MGDYHDFVIRDGRLVGEFEEMYKKSDDIPWHQDKTSFSLHADLDIALLKHFKQKNENLNILDLGCGMGFFTDRILREACLDKNVIISGADISQTAVDSANKRFSHIKFFKLDILKDDISKIMKKYNLIVFRDILWYVCHEQERFIENIKALLTEDGGIFLSQSIPNLDKYYGQDVFPDSFSMINLFEKHFECLYSHSLYEKNNIRKNVIYSYDKYVRFFGKIK